MIATHRLTRRLAPAAILALGILLTAGLRPQRPAALGTPLEVAVPRTLLGHAGHDVVLSEGEERVLGATSYLMRSYRPSDESAATPGFTVYVGYYASQMQGRTIHSPRNCLPGAGWSPLTSSTDEVTTAAGTIRVNRYLIQREDQRALVYYWYQGRGRVQANEYRVKWDLLRDAALMGRSDEALVRVMVPAEPGAGDPAVIARQVSAELVAALDRALPG